MALVPIVRIFDFFSPMKVFRRHISKPIEAFVLQQIFAYKKKTKDGFESFKEILYRAIIILVFVSAILWTSIFMYIVFYYTYMPNITHMRPVHLQFKSCDESAGICSFPSAHVQLTRRSQMLMPGQPYTVKLVLDMPESPTNKHLGMFMVCAQMRSNEGALVSSSCRSAMLRHRSLIHHVMRTLFYAPLLLSGQLEEKQTVQVELFSDFEDDQSMPVTDAYVELQTRHIQVYGCELQVEAHFTGLRYLMYNWPSLSALFGISTNLFFVSLVFILSWYHLQDGLPDFMKMRRTSESSDDASSRLIPCGDSNFPGEMSYLEDSKHFDSKVSVCDDEYSAGSSNHGALGEKLQRRPFETIDYKINDGAIEAFQGTKDSVPADDGSAAKVKLERQISDISFIEEFPEASCQIKKEVPQI